MNITVKELVNGCYPQKEDICITFSLDKIEAFEVVSLFLEELKNLNQNRIELNIWFGKGE